MTIELTIDHVDYEVDVDSYTPPGRRTLYDPGDPPEVVIGEVRCLTTDDDTGEVVEHVVRPTEAIIDAVLENLHGEEAF